MKRAVFIDRDGVLNRAILIEGAPRPPTSIKEVEILDGVLEAIQILKRNEFVPIVVTNQPDVARGFTTRSKVEAINAHIGSMINVSNFYTCFHDDNDLCDCRKPSPGLIIRAARELQIDIAESFMVGDRWRDISAGQKAGCCSFFIDYSYDERQPCLPFIKVSSLLQAVRIMTGDANGSK
jgi:D-glycero-D-manno-heptose 1,7-bisphosphate phosphatase